jgi:hypothetical protein
MLITEVTKFLKVVESEPALTTEYIGKENHAQYRSGKVGRMGRVPLPKTKSELKSLFLLPEIPATLLLVSSIRSSPLTLSFNAGTTFTEGNHAKCNRAPHPTVFSQNDN